jgi:hypothetical protein
MRITKRIALTFVSLRASGHTILCALAQAVRHHFHLRKP